MTVAWCNSFLLSDGGGSEIGGDCDECRNCDCGCDFDRGVSALLSPLYSTFAVDIFRKICIFSACRDRDLATGGVAISDGLLNFFSVFISLKIYSIKIFQFF